MFSVAYFFLDTDRLLSTPSAVVVVVVISVASGSVCVATDLAGSAETASAAAKILAYIVKEIPKSVCLFLFFIFLN